MVPFCGIQLHGPARDSFNFYHSQLRIKVEQAFGFLVSKWLILRAPLNGPLSRHPKLILCCMILHNFIISERLRKEGTITTLKEEITSFDCFDTDKKGFLETPAQLQHGGFSFIRESIVAQIKTCNLVRPLHPLRKQLPRGFEKCVQKHKVCAYMFCNN